MVAEPCSAVPNACAHHTGYTFVHKHLPFLANTFFWGTKQIATDHRACLGAVIFKELAIMKSAWGPKLYNLTAWN
ncbi:hypothetical protein B0H34DRAFT_725974, partial [Crassisporium funariophilum]